MSRKLFSRLPHADERWEFFELRSNDVLASTGAPDADDIVTVFVRGSSVSTFVSRLAGRLTDMKSTALAFTVEDDLATPAETVHAVAGAQLAGGSERLIFVVSDVLMKSWVQQAQALKGRVRLVPPQSVIPPDAAPVDFMGDTLGWHQGRPVAVDADWPEEVRAALLAGAAANTTPLESLEQMALWHDAARGATDLRTGVYADRKTTSKGWRDWRVAAALAACLCVALIAESLLSTRAMQTLDTTLRARASSIYTAAHPGTQLPATLAKAQQSSKATSPNSGFQSLAAHLYTSAQRIDAARIESMRYDASRGELIAVLTVRTLADAEALAVTLKDAGVLRTQGELTSVAGTTEATFVLGSAQ